MAEQLQELSPTTGRNGDSGTTLGNGNGDHRRVGLNQSSLPSQAPTHRDLQRAALRDLVQLALECAATESQIEETFKIASETSEKEFDKHTWSSKQRHKQAEEVFRQKHSEHIGGLGAKCEQANSSIKTNDRIGRARLQGDVAHVEQEAKKKLDQAVWLAEGVLEVAQNQIREERAAIVKQLKASTETLNALETDAAKLMLRYSQEPGLDLVVNPEPGCLTTSESANAPPEQMDPASVDALLAGQTQSAQRGLETLQALRSPRMLVGAMPYVFCVVVIAAAGVAAQLSTGLGTLQLQNIGIAMGAALAFCLIVVFILKAISRSSLRRHYTPLRQAIANARAVSEVRLQIAERTAKAEESDALAVRDSEVRQAKEELVPGIERARRARDVGLQALQGDTTAKLAEIQQQQAKATSDADEWLARRLAEEKKRFELEQQGLSQRHGAQRSKEQDEYDRGRQALEQRLREGLSGTQAPIETGRQGPDTRDWSDPAWKNWTPTRTFASMVPFGELEVDLKKIAHGVAGERDLKLALPERFSSPMLLAFPRQASVLIQTDRAMRPEAIRVMQMLMVHLLTSLPPGRVRFTIIDPVGLGQNFAGFMHLADYDEALVGGRILTDAEQIEQRLEDLTNHMETVIQKYLRNEFETIDDYNAQAGELAEPYRFLIIADFPVGFEGDSYRRLSSIATSGARCGVYIIVARDLRQEINAGTVMDDLEAHSVNLVQEGNHLIWKDDVFGQFPLYLDPPPSEETLTELLHAVGKGAKEAARVEVSFNTIAPSPEEFWSASCTDELRVPIGRFGATRLQNLRLGKGVAQHTLMAGKTGSGKSTLLHAIVTNLAMWYPPEEVEFFLIDFKKGVEFKTYATQQLPHARAIAVESDREFGLSVLQRLDAELTRRGDLYRRMGVQDLAAYRAAARAAGVNIALPRTLLVIDEFQEFFSEDDKLAQEASVLIDRLVRQGRAFGVHVLLGSQTIGGSGLPRSTLGQMAVRIALQCSDADSQLILGDNNSAARLLSRPGEAIYNDQGGLVEANSPFQVAWLSDEQRERFLIEVRRRFEARPTLQPVDGDGPLTIVFEGNAPADITTNRRLSDLLRSPHWLNLGSTAPVAWFGDPVAIKEPSGVAMRRQSGVNVLIIGQQEESAMAILNAAMVSLAAQQRPGKAIFYIFDGSPADSPFAGLFPKLKQTIPQEVNLTDYRAVPDSIDGLIEEMHRRQGSSESTGPDQLAPSIYVIIYGLQRYRVLRKADDEFSFGSGSSDETQKPNTGKQFTDLVREGPPVGIHILAWCDTPVAVERTLDRGVIREFDNRVLFQMSAADSSNIIDSPAANKLGFHRALIYSEEQGVMEKFRPYAPPKIDWLTKVQTSLAAKGP